MCQCETVQTTDLQMCLLEYFLTIPEPETWAPIQLRFPGNANCNYKSGLIWPPATAQWHSTDGLLSMCHSPHKVRKTGCQFQPFYIQIQRNDSNQITLSSIVAFIHCLWVGGGLQSVGVNGCWNVSLLQTIMEPESTTMVLRAAIQWIQWKTQQHRLFPEILTQFLEIIQTSFCAVSYRNGAKYHRAEGNVAERLVFLNRVGCKHQCHSQLSLFWAT